jgi:hypothetical protein
MAEHVAHPAVLAYTLMDHVLVRGAGEGSRPVREFSVGEQRPDGEGLEPFGLLGVEEEVIRRHAGTSRPC